MSLIGLATDIVASAALQRTFLLQTNTATGIPVLLAVLDAVHEETPEFTADVTQHPVEEGTEISDHIQLKNPTLKLSGTISNTPLDLSVSIANTLAGGIAAITSSQARSNILNTGISQASAIAGASLMGKGIGGGFAGASDAISRTILLNAYEQRQPFDVITRRQRYESMVIERLSFPRDKSTGFQLVFQMELIRLRIVSPFAVQIDSVSENTVTSATSETNLGGQATKEVSAQTKSAVNKSWLRQATNGKFPGLSG